MSIGPKLTAVSLTFAALTACSGGAETTGIEPVFAPAAPVLPTDYDGKTFPVRYFGIDLSGPAVTRFRGSGSAEFINEQEITLTIDGNTFVLVDTLPIDGELTDGTATVEFNAFSSNLIGFDGNDGVSDLYFGVFGFQTDPSDMPNTPGPSGFSSVDTSSLILTGAIDIQLDGDVSLIIDFGAKTVSGSMFTDAEFNISIENGTIIGNTINGTVTATYDDGLGGGPVPVATQNTDVDGWFFGNTAVDLAATYIGDFTASVGPGFDSFVGGFIAQD